MSKIDVELEDRTVTIDCLALRRVQALWRGAVVRQQLLAVRRSYEQVVTETELPGFALNLTWKPDPLTLPQFTKSGKPGLTVTTLPETKAKPKNTEKITKNSEKITKGVPTKDSEIESELQLTEPADTRCTTSTSTSEVDKEISIPIVSENDKDDFSEKESETQHSTEKQAQISNQTTSPSERTDGLMIDKPEKVNNEIDKRASGRPSDEEVCSLNQNTAVWDTMDASRFPASTTAAPETLDRESLVAERNTVAMELLWIEQAIDSRKQYLRLRQQMAGGAT